MASIVSAGTTSATALNMSADTTGILQLASNNGTVALTISTSQNVGIGTSSPAYKLDVAGTIQATGTGYSSATSPTVFLNNSTASTGRIFALNSYNSGGFQIVDATAGGATRLEITSAGVTNIYGPVTISNANATNELTFTGAEFTNIFSQTTSGFQFGTSGTGYLALMTNNAEQARIDSSGNLMIGTTSTVASAKLTVNGQIATSGFIAINASTATTVATGISFLAVVRCRGSGGSAVVLYENAQTPVIIAQTGAVGFTTGAPSANQIQLANAAGNFAMTALSGSSVGNNNLNVTVIANQ
jgi:hypothetical protein